MQFEEMHYEKSFRKAVSLNTDKFDIALNDLNIEERQWDDIEVSTHLVTLN